MALIMKAFVGNQELFTIYTAGCLYLHGDVSGDVCHRDMVIETNWQN